MYQPSTEHCCTTSHHLDPYLDERLHGRPCSKELAPHSTKLLMIGFVTPLTSIYTWSKAEDFSLMMVIQFQHLDVWPDWHVGHVLHGTESSALQYSWHSQSCLGELISMNQAYTAILVYSIQIQHYSRSWQNIWSSNTCLLDFSKVSLQRGHSRRWLCTWASYWLVSTSSGNTSSHMGHFLIEAWSTKQMQIKSV